MLPSGLHRRCASVDPGSMSEDRWNYLWFLSLLFRSLVGRRGRCSILGRAQSRVIHSFTVRRLQQHAQIELAVAKRVCFTAEHAFERGDRQGRSMWVWVQWRCVCYVLHLHLVLPYTLRYEYSVQHLTCEYSTAGQSPTVLYDGGGVGGALQEWLGPKCLALGPGRPQSSNLLEAVR